jgi:Ca2+-binding RTX toxin-like protein
MRNPLKALAKFLGAGATLAVLSVTLVPAASANTHVSVSGTNLVVTGGTLERQSTAITGPDFRIPIGGGFNPPTAPQGLYDVRETASGGPHEDPGAGCTSVSSLEVHCTPAGISRISIDANDRDDSVTIAGGVTVASGFKGGLGNDVLRGGSEPDFFNTPNDDGADQYYGGGGEDKVDYGIRVLGVSVVLDTHSNDGAPGENDFVSGDIEDVQGSVVEGRDTLIGNDLNNVLDGGGAKDDLTGGRGSDTLIGGDGDDVIHDDLDQTADTFECGAGFDQVFLDLVDFNQGTITDCEKQAASAIDQHPNVAIKVGAVVRMDRHRRVRLRLACPRAQRHGCRNGRLTLNRGKHKLGSHRYSLHRGKQTTLVLRLSRREAARVRRSRHGVAVRATAREKDPKGRPKVTIAQFRLRAKH